LAHEQAKDKYFSNGIAILFCFLQMFLIKAVLGQYEIAIALPFVIANIVAGFVTVRLLPKHGWFITKSSA
jgi:hypothetical protein